MAELKKALSEHYRRHPEIIMTRTKRRFSQEPGWRIVWTPPLEPDCQPIERLWGQVKNNVAWSYKVGRTVEETRQQLLRFLRFRVSRQSRCTYRPERGYGQSLPRNDTEVKGVDGEVDFNSGCAHARCRW